MIDSRYNRRHFLHLMGLGVAGVAGPAWLTALAQDPGFKPLDADLVVFNARIYTVDAPCPRQRPLPSGRALPRGGQQRATSGPHGQGDPDIRWQTDDRRPRLH